MHAQPQIHWAPGMRVGGRYVIRRILGQGGMGVVAIADDLLLRKPVALKALLPYLTSRPQSVELFFKEVAVAHAVTHPNIIRTYDLGEDRGIFFFTMEYLQGEALDDRLKRMGGKLTVPEVRELALIVCDALDAAHQAGVVHRDLKPSNIMLVNEPRQLVLLDFGISGFTGTSTEESPEQQYVPRDSWAATSAGLGTPVYMPPEQWQKQPCGPPSDLYSLGVILFQCLTGRPPFSGDNFMAFFTAHLHEQPPRLRSIDPKLPKDFDETIARCLEKDPAKRIQSARDLAEALRPKRRFRRTLEFVGRALIIAVLLALIGYGVFQFAKHSIIVEMRPGLHCLAQTVARGIDPADLEGIHTEDDMATAEFQRVFRHLQDYASTNPQIRYMYVLRKMPEGQFWEYVVDKDAYDRDVNENNQIDPGEEGTPPGETWDGSRYPATCEALENGGPTSDEDFALEGQWGMLLSGYARVGDRSGAGGYIVGVDSNNARLVRFRNGLVLFFAISWLAILIVPALFFKKRGKPTKDDKGGRSGEPLPTGSSGGPRTMNPQSMTRPPDYRSTSDPYRR